jgi:antibiotic biosynthesis monooxygenase (ABM) superfamily enzyme
MKKILTTLFTVGCLLLGSANLAAADTAPKSVIHIVTVGWKAGTTPEQIQAALDGAKALPAAYPGITRVWVKTIKAQNPKEVAVKKTHVIVMEFADEAALKGYTDSAAQKAWYKLYLPIREQSATHDVTN